MMIEYSIGHGARQSQGIEQKQAANFAEFFADILAHPSANPPTGPGAASRAEEVKRGGAWFACAYEGGRRSKATARPRPFVVLDIDRMPAEKRPQLEEFCGRYEGLLYDSFSSTPQAPRYRVVLAASRAIVADEMPRVTEAVRGALLQAVGAWDADTGECLVDVDACSGQLERLYFTPTGRDVGKAKHFTGRPVDVDAVLPVAVADPRQSRAKKTAKATAALPTAAEDPVLAALDERGMVLGEDAAKGYWHIRCPFEHEHTGNSGASECAYMPPTAGYRYGQIHCMHAHCKDRPQADFFKALGLDNFAYKVARDDERQRPEDFSVGGARYRATEAGVAITLFTSKGKPLPEELMCAPLEVLGSARDEEQNGWGALVRWRDGDGRTHERVLADADLVGAAAVVRNELAAGGLRLKLSGPRAHEYLANFIYHNPARDLRRIRLVNRTGWYKGAYVLPDETLQPTRSTDGQKPEEVRYASAGAPGVDYAQRGTIDGWREGVAVPARYSKRLMLALCVAFAAPLLRLVSTRRESGGFQFYGRSSVGKSLCGKAAASLYGNPAKKALQWSSTANSLEGYAFAHNDSLLLLDEAATAGDGGRRANSSDIASTIYRLANGTEKGRMQKTGELREQRQWSLLFLSTSEASVETLLKRKGANADTGVGVRCIGIKADAEVSAGGPAGATAGTLGVFDSLPEGESFKSFTAALATAMEREYGAAGRAWLQWLVDNPEQAKAGHQQHAKALAAAVGGELSDGQISRVFSRFALCAAAGEMATEQGLTGWDKGAAVAAAADLFSQFRASRGGDNAELRRLLENLDDVLHDLNKFDDSFSDASAVYGYILPEEREQDLTNTGENPAEPHTKMRFFLKPKVLAGLSETWSQTDIARKLAALGIVEPPPRSEKARNLTVRQRVGKGTPHLYKINPEALDRILYPDS